MPLQTALHDTRSTFDMSHKQQTMDAKLDRAVESIEKQSSGSRALAFNALAWVAYAQRPLTVRELEHAVAIDIEDSEPQQKHDIVKCESIINCCAGLIEIQDDRAKRIVRLTDSTTQADLQDKIAPSTKSSLRKLAERLTHSTKMDPASTISLKCLKYLSSAALDSGACSTKFQFQDRLESHPLLDYAAKHWMDHVRYPENNNSKDIDQIHEAAMALLNRPQFVRAVIQIMDENNPWTKDWETACITHLLARLDSTELLRPLLARDVDIEARDGRGRTPLSVASIHGRAAVVKLLLEQETVKVNSRDNDGWTSLSWASAEGHSEVVKLLLANKKVDVDSRDDFRRTPLSVAARFGKTAAVELLLAQEGVDVNSRDDEGFTPLSRAAYFGEIAPIKLLLAEDRVDVTLRNKDGQTLLCIAAHRGHAAVVRLLLALKDGLDVNSRDKEGQTPLYLAVVGGYIDIVKLLMAEQGIDINLPNNAGKTPLEAARWKRNPAMVALLSANGAR